MSCVCRPPFKVLFTIVLPTLIPTLFSLTVMTFVTGVCAMSAPQLLGYSAINPEIVRLAGSSTADESFPQARAALLSVILAIFTVVVLSILSAYERKGHYLSVSKTQSVCCVGSSKKLLQTPGCFIQELQGALCLACFPLFPTRPAQHCAAGAKQGKGAQHGEVLGKDQRSRHFIVQKGKGRAQKHIL